MSQRELAELVGLIARHQISTHERSVAIPSLLVALSYEAIFRVPVKELFADLYGALQQNIEERLAEMEQTLHNSTAKGRKAQIVARKLEWLWERKNFSTNDSTR